MSTINILPTRPALSDTLSVLLPTREQTLLLQTCLYSGDAGRKAGEAWLQQRQELQNDLKEDSLKGLLPLLFHALRRNEVEVPNTFLTILRTASLREELRTKTYRRICGQVFFALTAAEIPFLALKGIVLADTIYGDPALRHSHDIDILLSASDPSCAVSALSSLGFVPLTKGEASQWQDIQLAHQSGLPLVLHRHFFRIPLYNAATADLWTRSQTQVVAEVPVRTLSPADALLHICGHASYCPSRESLRWVCDAWFLIDRHRNLDWEALLDSATCSHLALPLSVMLEYLVDELQAPIPTGFLARLRAAASQADTVEREFALWGARVGTQVRLRSIFAMTRDWPTQVFILKWLLFPSPRYLRSLQQIPWGWLLPLYYAYRPLRYATRYVWWRYKSHTQYKTLHREPSLS